MQEVLGGVLIGLAASLMLLFNGRVAGISGIVGGLLNSRILDKSWRILFILGLLSGGLILQIISPGVFNISTSNTTSDFLLAGFLVGFGTLMGNGCTSGHGVCGISRFSARSIVATLIFICTGVLSVILFKFSRGGL